MNFHYVTSAFYRLLDIRMVEKPIMIRTISFCILVVILAVGLMLPSYAFAKRFKSYPGSNDNEQKDSKDKPAPLKDVPSMTDTNKSEETAESGKESDENKSDEGKDKEDNGDEESEHAPGMFGYALHGKDWLKVEYLYSGEIFSNTHGGISTHNATKYLGLFNLAITSDLDKLDAFPGGKIFLLGENSHGQGLSEHYVGDEQLLSNIDPLRPYTQVSEFWWQKEVIKDFFSIRLGKQDANIDFAVVDLGGDFVNSSFGLHHNIPMPSWPNPAMGITTLFQLSESLQFKAGSFDGAADGRSWGFSGTGDVFSIFEVEKQWKLCGNKLPGDYHVGMWYHRGDWENVVNPNITYNNNHGVYMGLDQLIFKESDKEDDDQGLGVFGQYGWSQEDRNRVPNYIGAGLVYKGLIPNRDEDTTGIGMAKAIFSPYLEGYGAETAIELFHKVKLTRYVDIQPDIQYIAHPGGQHPDALAVGVCFKAVL